MLSYKYTLQNSLLWFGISFLVFVVLYSFVCVLLFVCFLFCSYMFRMFVCFVRLFLVCVRVHVTFVIKYVRPLLYGANKRLYVVLCYCAPFTSLLHNLLYYYYLCYYWLLVILVERVTTETRQRHVGTLSCEYPTTANIQHSKNISIYLFTLN